MIDLHTHTLLSDGDLLASELVRRAVVKGYEAIALTDHVDWSNIDFILPRLIRVSKSLNCYWPIKVIPGIEITHAPLEEIGNLVKFGRDKGAHIVIVHGETLSEPVIPGTNRKAIECKVDILSHPGALTEEDAKLAKENGVCLEITTRKNHSKANSHIKDIAKRVDLKLILNTDTHQPEDLISDVEAGDFLTSLGFSGSEMERIKSVSKMMVENLRNNWGRLPAL